MFSRSSKSGVVSTPIHNGRHSSKGTMSRHVGSGAAAAVRKPARKYGAKYLFGPDYATLGNDVTSANDHMSNASRARSSDRAANLNRVRSVEGARTKSRERQESSNSHGGHKHNVKGHDSKERHKPFRKVSIDPKLRDQIIEEAVRKARERQLSRNKETSRSKSHGAKVERSETMQVKRKSSGNDHRSKEKTGKLKESPLGRLNASHDSYTQSRDRTPDDIEEWLKWRCYLNHQLSMYIVKGNSTRTQVPVDIMSVPEKLNKDTRSAIWSHAQKEKPKTSLDSNAYIVYGIPRARLRPNCPSFQISHYAVPFKGKNRQDPKRPLSPEQHPKTVQATRTYMSPRDYAQQHGLAEKRPLSPKQKLRPISPKNIVRTTSPSISRVTRNREKRPMSPAKLPHTIPDITQGRPQNTVEGTGNKLSKPVVSPGLSRPVLQPVGPANLREMYKKPFLRTMSEQSYGNGPSSPKKPVSAPITCAQGPSSGYQRPVSPLALYSHGIETTEDTQKEDKMEYDRNIKFSPPKTIYAKRTIARTNTDVTMGSEVTNQSYIKISDSQSRGYMNVPDDLVEDHTGPGAYCAPPPTPPPLPPKSFHVRK